MTQQPRLFDWSVVPAYTRTERQAHRLQALYDIVRKKHTELGDVEIVRKWGAWYASGDARWIGDNGMEWIGLDCREAARWIWRWWR